jgi:predicted TIM-barrel fold metal-dependent hydrolase
MQSLEFVDTHVHFYDLRKTELVYSWLQPEWVHPLIGDINGIKTLVYGADQFLSESRFSNVTKTVHVQAALGAIDPVQETEWLESMADRTGCPNGIIAHSDLRSPDVESELERHVLASDRVRGIRDFGGNDFLADPAWQRGYALLEKFELLCDLDCTWEEMGKARDLAQRYPNVPVVIEHAGFPRSRSDEYFRAWKGGIFELAKAENAFCKISGLGMLDQRWTIESLRPWVLTCIEAFGVGRSFFASNWPVDRLFSSYDALISAYAEIISGFSASEQVSLFSANAERFYRI